MPKYKNLDKLQITCNSICNKVNALDFDFQDESLKKESFLTKELVIYEIGKFFDLALKDKNERK